MNNNILFIGESSKIKSYLQENLGFNVIDYSNYRDDEIYLFIISLEDVDFNKINYISQYIILYSEDNLKFNTKLINNCFKYYTSLSQLDDLYHIFLLKNDYLFND